MKDLKYIIFAISICLFAACSKTDSIMDDDQSSVVIFDESVSGNVMVDEDDDGIADFPLRDAKVYLGDWELLQDIIGHDLDSLADTPGGEIYKDIICTYVDLDGNYIFNSIPPFENYSLAIYSDQVLESIVGIDVTPDGDLMEQAGTNNINVTLLEDEQDDGNNFIVTFKELNASISGYVMIDNDKDGIIDGPQPNVRIKLSRADDDGNPLGGTTSIASSLTDFNGYYSFNNLDEGRYVVIFNEVSEYIVTASGDVSPDNDPVLAPTSYWIPVNLEDDEIDEDNNFDIIRVKTSGSGNILEDTDGDGIGDTPVGNLRVELYERNSNGVPTGTRVSEAYSDPTGQYDFRDVPVGEYVIYYIGEFGYECIRGEDISPEAGEPAFGPEPFFIPMNITDPDVEDLGNNYTIKRI